MGLDAVDLGTLHASARHIEGIPLAFFTTWKIPAIVATLAFLFFFLVTLFHNQICPNIDRLGIGKDWNWQQFVTVPLNNTQSCLGNTACLLLIACYFPGIIAAYLQLWRGTKYSDFPVWLDVWLKVRKEIGLSALLLGSTHGCLAIFTKMSYGMENEWWQQVYVLCGGLLEMVLIVLGISSLPSISTTLTWREFTVLQRYLGWSSVVLVTAHMVVANIHYLLMPLKCVVIPSAAQMSTIMKLGQGYCDLNIAVNTSDITTLKTTVLKALSMGYQTVAINTEITDNTTPDTKKKKKKGDYPCVPPPPKLTLTSADLRKHNVTRDPVILTRITVTYSDPGSPFLSKYRDLIKLYDLIAFTPTTEAALKQTVSQTLVEVDLISLSIGREGDTARFSRKLLHSAIEKDIYYEVCYGPCIFGSGARQQTITLAHSLHRKIRSANVIVSSRARTPDHLRPPYDVMNLGRFLGLTEAGAKEALVSMSHCVVYCAAVRRKGRSKCLATVTILKEKEDGKRNVKFDGLESAAKYLKVDNE
ncbi:hypothetical protein Pmani_039169 [Petrolisthes manimaculis]|uniref:Ferric oxidoreductase domain-containing protein n=1 Tax=Petrolisthes manimaculis TaxID=1843537 RepID=A0AAE1NE79_9EUCA|nr:hypothetical protein Pmani_039169 [Petrolisthes manimaculis]